MRHPLTVSIRIIQFSIPNTMGLRVLYQPPIRSRTEHRISTGTRLYINLESKQTQAISLGPTLEYGRRSPESLLENVSDVIPLWHTTDRIQIVKT